MPSSYPQESAAGPASGPAPSRAWHRIGPPFPGDLPWKRARSAASPSFGDEASNDLCLEGSWKIQDVSFGDIKQHYAQIVFFHCLLLFPPENGERVVSSERKEA